MEHGDWVEPQPMATTSLRLPADVIDELKQQARTRHVRYTTYVRSILERAARGGAPAELAEITERLDRIQRALTESHSQDDQKTALDTAVTSGLIWGRRRHLQPGHLLRREQHRQPRRSWVSR
jgi:predicted DNA-binding protein